MKWLRLPLTAEKRRRRRRSSPAVMIDGNQNSCSNTTEKKVIFAMIISLVVVALCLAGWFLQFVTQAAPGNKSESEVVVVPKGTSVKEINAILARSGLVKDDVRFLVLARYLGLASQLQAGEFALHRGQTPQELLKELATAKPIQHAVVIREGLNVTEIARVFADGGWCDAEEFVRLAKDPAFLKSLGLGSYKSLEGYLYPDTYYLTRKGHTTADLIRMQVHHFFAVWKDIKAVAPFDLSSYEVLILASMVEKETAKAEERPLIAGVFYNRLKKGMRLQSDPTVVYGVENYSGKITRKHLRTPTPYNTYTLKRLPVGPISNPGKAALVAVLHPTKSTFYYFVSQNDGSHKFSATLREHNRAVNKYQRSKKKQVTEN